MILQRISEPVVSSDMGPLNAHLMLARLLTLYLKKNPTMHRTLLTVLAITMLQVCVRGGQTVQFTGPFTLNDGITFYVVNPDGDGFRAGGFQRVRSFDDLRPEGVPGFVMIVADHHAIIEHEEDAAR